MKNCDIPDLYTLIKETPRATLEYTKSLMEEKLSEQYQRRVVLELCEINGMEHVYKAIFPIEEIEITGTLEV